MSIEFRCFRCDRLLRAVEASAGKKTRCPTCEAVQPIPRRQTNVARPSVRPKPRSSVSPPAVAVGLNPDQINIVDRPSRRELEGRQFTQEQARARIIVPAIGMIVCAVLGCAVGLFVLFPQFVMLATGRPEMVDPLAFVFVGLPFTMEVIVIAGSARMLLLRNYTLAIIASIVTILCGLGTLLLPVPFAVWGLIVLCDERVRVHFR